MPSIHARDSAITVIIPNWNGARLLPACLNSVLHQSDIQKEIIVVDNASTDASLDILAAYGDTVRVVQLASNLGFARAVNAGITIAENGLLFILNNDTVLEQDCLARLLRAVERFPEYGSYAPEIRNFDDHTKLWAAGLMYSDRGYGNRSGRQLLAGISEPVEIFGVCGAAALFKQSVLSKVGLFNEDFFVYHEDVELSLRHQLMGYRCLYVPGALVYHHGSATLKRIFRTTVEHRMRNAMVTAVTCIPRPIWQKYIKRILWFYVRLSGRLICRGYFWSWAKAVLYVLLHPYKLWSRRSLLQLTSNLDIMYLESLLYRGPIEVNFPDNVVEL